jgi:RNA polymerase sigma-70 factor (ECF subfamily)
LDLETQLIQELQRPRTRDKAYNKLIDLYQERLYWHIRKIVITHDNANDVLQNTFIKVFKGIANFKANSSLLTWMFRIAYNESIRFLHKDKRSAAHSIQNIKDKYLENLSADPYFDGGELQLKLHSIIAELTEKQQEVFQMKYFDELSFPQIAEILQTNENTLKSTYYSATKIIEEKIVL